MKKGIGKTISIIVMLTLLFQIVMPLTPVFHTETLAADETTVEQQSTDEQTEATEAISRDYEIKEEETWDISANGDGSVIAKWTRENRTLTISGTGIMKDWTSDVEEDWHNTQYTNIIETVIINQEIVNIGEYAFYECSMVKEINISEEVTNIGEYTFYRCSNLEEIELPEGVTSIEDSTFYGCSSLKEINLPEGVTSIGNNAFNGCSNLISINVDENNGNYSSENGVLFNKDKTIIHRYPEGKKDVAVYNIPESVTIISVYAFSGCTSLTNINITKNVTGIGNYAFEECVNLVEINIPESVISIGMGAFDGCGSLIEINLPEGITRINYRLFNGCSSLTSINIPEKVTSIDNYAFNGCSSLTNINIPESVTVIRESTFSGCTNLTSINIPENVTSIGNSAFKECSSLVEIDIPKGITSIGSSAFLGCISLTNINLPEGITSISKKIFSGCTSLSSINIPKSVTSIEWNAFEKCTSLMNIVIPGEIMSIKYNAFPQNTIIYASADSEGHRYAEEGKQAYFLEGSPTTISTNYEIKEEETWDISANGDESIIAKWTLSNRTLTISGTGKMKDWDYSSEEDWHKTQYTDLIEKVVIEQGATNIGNDAFNECSNLTEIDIPEGVISIGNEVFCGCSSIKNINIPESVNSIGEYTFSGCSSLKNINIPEGVARIEQRTFEGCSSLIEINISRRITSIGWYAFRGCSNLTEINIPENIETIEKNSFEKCSNLISINVENNNKNFSSENGILFNKSRTEIIKYPEGKKDINEYTIPEGVISIGESSFSENVSLIKINIPEGVTNIEPYAFSGCSYLKEINIPEEVTSIGSGAFEGCSSLTNITIPQGVTNIENYTFNGCSSLDGINIPEGVISIGYNAFTGCSSLRSIIIPEGVTNIQDSVFYRCSNLESITIPETVTSIGDSAFSGCSSLKSVALPESITTIGYNAFHECSNLENITIPEGVTSIGNDAFYECTRLKSLSIPEGVMSIGSRLISSSTIIYVKSNSEGHKYAEENKQGYIIDDMAPTVTFSPNAGENVQKEYSVKIQVQDNMEEVGVNENSLKYQWTQSETEPAKESFTESFENGQTIIKNTGDGVWYLWVYADDDVGNETITRSEGFNFDNTAPNGSIKYSTKNPTKENVIVTITSNEEIQEIEGWTLSSDRKILTKEYNANTKETITIKDLAGNETLANIEISNIDKTAPIGTIEYSTKELTNKNVTVTITSNEEVQAVEGWTLSLDKKILTKEYSANTKETIIIKDLAGNEAQANIEISNIDKTLPEITIGDINQDEKIDITDMFLLKRHMIAGSIESWRLKGDSLIAADMDKNGVVDISDYLLLKRHLVQN